MKEYLQSTQLLKIITTQNFYCRYLELQRKLVNTIINSILREAAKVPNSEQQKIPQVNGLVNTKSALAVAQWSKNLNPVADSVLFFVSSMWNTASFYTHAKLAVITCSYYIIEMAAYSQYSNNPQTAFFNRFSFCKCMCKFLNFKK